MKERKVKNLRTIWIGTSQSDDQED